VFLRFEIDPVYQNDRVQGSLGCSSGCSSAGCIHEPTPTRTSGSSIYPAVQNMPLAARALGLGATLTTLHLQFEKEAEAALGLPPNVHSYALLPIGYPMGRFGPVRRVPLADVVYEDRWNQAYRDL
jgi:nitroreductase